MNGGTCSTCIWWGSEGLRVEGAPEGHKSCDHNRKTDCFAEDGMDVISEEPNSHIVTGPNFGCVNHETEEELTALYQNQ